MTANALWNYIAAQGELGGFEVVLPQVLSLVPKAKPPVAAVPAASPSVNIPKSPEKPAAQPAFVPNIEKKSSAETWEGAKTLDEFYECLAKSALYNGGNVERCAGVAGAPYLLVFYSPGELPPQAGELLQKILAAIKIKGDSCVSCYFAKRDGIKSNLPRVNKALYDMLSKEVSLLCPQRIIFWHESFAREAFKLGAHISETAGSVHSFAERPSIVLPSLKDMLANPQVKRSVWNIYLRKPGWFEIQ